MLKNKGGLSHNIGQNLKNFPRLRRGFPIQGCSFHCFYLGNHCFYRCVCYFFASAAPKPSYAASETVREFNQQLRSQTGTSEEWNILTRKEIALVLCRDAPQARKFWVLRYHKQDFKCKNRVFESFLECFRSGNTWKYLKIFGLRPGLWLNQYRVVRFEFCTDLLCNFMFRENLQKTIKFTILFLFFREKSFSHTICCNFLISLYNTYFRKNSNPLFW